MHIVEKEKKMSYIKLNKGNMLPFIEKLQQIKLNLQP